MTDKGRIVMVCYRPKPGKGTELRELMKTHLSVLAEEGLINDRPSTIMTAENGTIVEIFEWRSKQAIEQAHENPRVNWMWEAYAEVCDYIPVSQLPEAQTVFSEFTPFSIEED